MSRNALVSIWPAQAACPTRVANVALLLSTGGSPFHHRSGSSSADPAPERPTDASPHAARGKGTAAPTETAEFQKERTTIMSIAF